MCFDLRCCIGLAIHLRQATKGKGVREDGIFSQLWPSLAHDVCPGWAQRLRPASSMNWLNIQTIIIFICATQCFEWLGPDRGAYTGV